MDLLLVILILLLLFGVPAVHPRWNYSRDWGYGPMTVIVVVLVAILIFRYV